MPEAMRSESERAHARRPFASASLRGRRPSESFPGAFHNDIFPHNQAIPGRAAYRPSRRSERLP
jgi:hypothetical protein